MFIGFSGGSVVCAGSRPKAERPPETRHDGVLFFIAFGDTVKIHWAC
jgi:hypothetical protein